MNDSIFQNFPKFKPKLAQIEEILEKSGDFIQHLVQNCSDRFMNGALFLEKLVFVWVCFQILQWHIPIKTKLELVCFGKSKSWKELYNERYVLCNVKFQFI